MSRNRKGLPWQVEIEATPKNENLFGVYALKTEVNAVSQCTAIAAARRMIMRKNNLNGREFRTRTISCNEL